MLTSVDSPEDPRLAPYTAIREKDLMHGHGGRFIVEGKVTLETLVRRSRFKPESLFLAESRLAPLEGLIADLPQETPVYVAPQDVMDEVAGFPLHRGVLACAQKGTALAPAAMLTSARTILVLIGLSNHDNVGACFRNAAAFGADAVLLDEACCDPLYRKSIRVSAGAALTVPFAHGGTPDALFSEIETAGFDKWCLTPRQDAAALLALTRPEKLAIVLGAEGPGLSDELIARGKAVRIAMTDGFDSVNVATAGAIALAHVFGSHG